MLDAIVGFSLRFRGIVLSLAVLMLGYGGYTLTHARYDVFPEFAPPQVSIQTEAPGLAPEQVEALITQPIENELNGIAGIQSLRSESVQGLSVVTLNFDAAQDIYRSRQAVTERLGTLGSSFPQGTGAPVMTPLTSSTGDLMTLGLVSDKLSLMELRALADWVVRPRLLAVPGVAQASIWGGQIRQIQIQIDPKKLVRYDLAVEDVLASAQQATGVRGGGFIDTDKQRIVLQLEGQSLTADVLGQMPLIKSGGSSGDIQASLSDVARVVDAPAPGIGAATVMGKPGIVINLWAQYGANTLQTTQGVDQALAQLMPELERQGVTLTPDLFRSANFIQTAVYNIRTSLEIGACLVMLVLFLFLMDVRTSLISCTAIPLSLLAAMTLLDHLGFTLNTMTLGGLAIATGEVVDDAVIDVENILRRLRENRLLAQPLPVARVVLEASLEVRHAVIYAAAAVSVVFMPIISLSGLAGRLFGPLGLTYIFAILASLGIALTVTPALCLLLLGNRTIETHEPPLMRWLKARYRRLLAGVERYPRGVITAVLLFLVVGLGIVPFLGGEFLPAFREGHYIVHMIAPPGTSLAESVRMGTQATEKLLQFPFVRSVAQRVGRAAADDTYGPETSEFEVDLKPGSTASASTEEDIRKTLEATLPGVSLEVNTFLTERIAETLSGYTSSVVVNLFGSDLNVLDQKANDVLKVMQSVPGAADAQIQSPPGAPEITVRLRSKDLIRWGVDPVTVLDAVSVAYQGKISGQIYDGNRVFDLAVMLDPALRQQPKDLGALRVRNAAGTYVLLKEVADIQWGTGRHSVLHEAAQRVQTITCNVEGRDMKSFFAELQRSIATQVRLPAGVYAAYGGTSTAQSQSQRDLVMHALAAGAVIVMLLSIVMGHPRNLFLVLLNLPMALVGGVLAVALTHQNLSIGCLVGFVTLFGITLRNSLMMISHFDHLVTVEGLPWGLETAMRGASERLTPVVMTALVTALGLLPLAWGSGAAGREIEGPMALVILGGLCTSTVLNLLVLPTLALRFGRFGEKG